VTSISGQADELQLDDANTLAADSALAELAAKSAEDDAFLASLRVLIVHDWIVAWGGAERTVEQLLTVFPRADLVVGVLGEGRRELNAVTRRARETWLARLPFARQHHRWFLPLYPAAFATVDTTGYDLVISSSHAFAKMVRTADTVPHLCYCHSPPRYLWDLQAEYRRSGDASGVALALAAPLLRLVDRLSAGRIDVVLANSHYIAKRIQRAYGRTAAVVHPPVTAKPVRPRQGPRDDALLSLGRLVPYKRVDLAIEAANALGARLLVAGDGPERARLERLAGPTVTFLGEVSEREAGELMERCRAMLFCGEEDFGIAPVEANAHGLPVIALRRGGVAESMRDGITAEFFDTPTVPAVVAAVRRAAGRTWDEGAIRANATRFSAGRFHEAIVDQVRQLRASGRWAVPPEPSAS
jgi:glycosyltransferase involved in cell wall biosynthesis